ncbi:MAG: VPLPA-CTERM sorting domain-containing protein [Pseudomonadota bacterium]
MVAFDPVPGTLAQTSQNLLFGFLGSDGSIPNVGTITAPVFAAFDPFARGEYSFRLVSPLFSDDAVAINVQAVPLHASLLLVLTGLGALATARRRA